jgi:hypothetical protein
MSSINKIVFFFGGSARGVLMIGKFMPSALIYV